MWIQGYSNRNQGTCNCVLPIYCNEDGLIEYTSTIKYVETTEPDKVAETIDKLYARIDKFEEELKNWKDGYIICKYENELKEKDHRIAVLERALELAIFYMDCVGCPLKSMNCETTCSDTKVYDYLIEMAEKGLEDK